MSLYLDSNNAMMSRKVIGHELNLSWHHEFRLSRVGRDLPLASPRLMRV